jgi:hypothetical protein
MIYVPDLNYSCYVLVNKDTIRAYEQTPYNPGYNQQISINYRDYYITSNYLYNDGSQSFSNYSQLPVCLDKSNLTTEIYYRTDLSNILVIFTIIVLFGFGIPLYLLKKMFRRL